MAYCDGNGHCHATFNGNEKDDVEEEVLTDVNEPAYKMLLKKMLASIPKAKLKFPNGLTRGLDGLIYVPSTIDGQIRVFSVKADKMLKQVDTIRIGMPLDNVSPDAIGDLYVPGFPKIFKAVQSMDNPYEVSAPVTIWRVKKIVSSGHGVESTQYKVEKVLEDRDSKFLSGSTTVRHDAKTGRLFIGGTLQPFSSSFLLWISGSLTEANAAAVHPYLAVCDPK